jgi:hypothetical protein
MQPLSSPERFASGGEHAPNKDRYFVGQRAAEHGNEQLDEQTWMEYTNWNA